MAARTGYLGPPGTFTEEALLGSALPGAVEAVPLETIYDTVMAVAEGRLDWAVVPIENSLDGSVTMTQDLLAEEAERVEVVGDTQLAVRHSLVAAGPIELDRIRTVTSHPQALGQCRMFLRRELPGATVRSASSTAEAVRLACTGGETGLAALGTSLAAEIYGGTILKEGVQDREQNETRFLWIAQRGRAEAAPPLLAQEDSHRTSLVFWGAGAESPGWLVGCLDLFARRGINLTRIESRPRRERLGHYMFFVDLQGGMEEAPVAEAVRELQAIGEQVIVLGSYPRALPRALHSGATADG